MWVRSSDRGPARPRVRRGRGPVRNRPAVEGLEGRQLMSLNVFSTPSGVETNQIAKGPNGALFFTETAANKIGEVTTAGVVTEFAIPTPNAQPTAIAAGADGNLYFIESGFSVTGAGPAPAIGRITPAGKITELSLPGNIFEVGGITAGPGGDVYFTATDAEATGEVVGRITPAGQISEFVAPVGFDAGQAITAGPDGNLWLSDPDVGAILRMTPAGAFTEFAVPSGPIGGIAAGPDGNLWFTDSTFIGRITTKGAVTEFPLPTKDSAPAAITAGRDGNLYFAGSSPGSGLGRITTGGVITQIAVPTSGGVAAGPDGNIYVTEDGKIAQFVLTGPVGTLPPVPARTTMSASPAVGTATSQSGATDAAIEAFSSGGGQASGDPSTAVAPGTTTWWHRKR